MPFTARLTYLAAACLLATMAAAGAAKADTIYDFVPLVSTGANGPIPPVAFALTLNDNFVAESFSRSCGFGYCDATGDFTDFSLAFTSGGHLLDTLDKQPDKTFEYTAGTIDGDSGSLFWATTFNTVTLTFGAGVWNAIVDSDSFPDACQIGGCTASGVLSQEVPEPRTLSILAVGLLGLAVLRAPYPKWRRP